MTSRRAKITWELRRAAGVPTSNVPVEPIATHVRGLVALGFSTPAIASAAGTSDATVREIAAGSHSPTRPVEKVRRRTAARLMAVAPSHIFSMAEPGHMVAAYAAKRRLRALQAIGWTLAHIDETLPDGKRATYILESGLAITAQSHRAACTAYRALAMKPGPSASSRTWAARRGSPPPLTWDDIDDPNPETALATTVDDATVDPIAVQLALDGQPVSLNRAERREAARRMTDLGIPASAIGARLGIEPRTIVRWRAADREEAAA